MKRLLLLFIQMGLAGTAFAQAPTDSTELYKKYSAAELTVYGKKGDVLQKVTGKESRLLDPAQNSPYRAINMMPSVNQQSVDPYGVADISSNHESFRIRGVEAAAGGMPGTTVDVESLPTTGRPGGGIFMYDLENFSAISFYTGAIPANKGFGISNLGAKIDMDVLRPDDKFGFVVKQDIGGSDFHRKTFIRINSGLLPLDFKGFGSYSNNYTDKWKGYGNSDRNNVMVGLVKNFDDLVKVEVFGVYNKVKLNAYRPLVYSQASNLGQYYYYDYGNNPAKADYYGYNYYDLEDKQVFGNIEFKLNDNSKINVKPYYWSDKGYNLQTQANNTQVRRWDIDHNVRGVLAEYGYKTNNLDVNLGYEYHAQNRPGPPSSWKLENVTSAGQLQFSKWLLLSNPSSFEIHTPFVQAKYTIGDFTVQGGLKYLYYKLPTIITYNTTGLGDVSYDDAMNKNLPVDEFASATQSIAYSKVLPNLTLSKSLQENLTLHFSYGETYSDQVDIYPTFISNEAAFKKAGISFKQLWDKEMETAHEFELGLRYVAESWRIVPTIYYAIHHNKPALIYNPAVNSNGTVVPYPGNVGDAAAYGAEVEAEVKLMENLSCYGSLSYNRFYFTGNAKTYTQTGTAVKIDGDQVPDAPEFLAKGFLSYKIDNFTITPIVRYTSSRYGDVLHQQKIDGVALFDLDVMYSTEMLGLKSVNLSVTFLNVFDKKYISMIATNDYSAQGNISYQPGNPFTVMGTISINY